MRHTIIGAAVAFGLVATAGVAMANGDEKCFDKGALAYVDCAPTDWSGWYIGAHAGYASAEVDGTFLLLDLGELDVEGFLAGGQVGFQQQLDNGLLLGLEVDFSGVWAEDSEFISPNLLLTPHRIKAGLDWLASARIRAGLPQGDWMPYLTGGVALAGYETTFSVHAPNNGGTSKVEDTAFGVVVGGGLEFLLDENWIAGVEGLYYFFDEDQSITDPVFRFTGSANFGDVAAARARLSYKF